VKPAVSDRRFTLYKTKKEFEKNGKKTVDEMGWSSRKERGENWTVVDYYLFNTWPAYHQRI
jgi:hypothetical protein